MKHKTKNFISQLWIFRCKRMQRTTTRAKSVVCRGHTERSLGPCYKYTTGELQHHQWQRQQECSMDWKILTRTRHELLCPLKALSHLVDVEGGRIVRCMVPVPLLGAPSLGCPSVCIYWAGMMIDRKRSMEQQIKRNQK